MINISEAEYETLYRTPIETGAGVAVMVGTPFKVYCDEYTLVQHPTEHMTAENFDVVEETEEVAKYELLIAPNGDRLAIKNEAGCFAFSRKTITH